MPRPVSSRSANPKRFATGCCTPPDGSRSTPAARSCASQRTGHGPASSPPRSRDYASCQHPLADLRGRSTTRASGRAPRRQSAADPLSRKSAADRRFGSGPGSTAGPPSRRRPQPTPSNPKQCNQLSPTRGYCTIASGEALGSGGAPAIVTVAAKDLVSLGGVYARVPPWYRAAPCFDSPRGLLAETLSALLVATSRAQLDAGRQPSRTRSG